MEELLSCPEQLQAAELLSRMILKLQGGVSAMMLPAGVVLRDTPPGVVLFPLRKQRFQTLLSHGCEATVISAGGSFKASRSHMPLAGFRLSPWQDPPSATSEASDFGDGEGLSNLQVSWHTDWHLPHGEFPKGTSSGKSFQTPLP